MDCDRAKGTGIAVAGSLPPSAIPPPTSTTTPITSSSGIAEVTNKTTSYSNKTSKPLSDVRPASENYARNGERREEDIIIFMSLCLSLCLFLFISFFSQVFIFSIFITSHTRFSQSSSKINGLSLSLCLFPLSLSLSLPLSHTHTQLLYIIVSPSFFIQGHISFERPSAHWQGLPPKVSQPD